MPGQRMQWSHRCIIKNIIYFKHNLVISKNIYYIHYQLGLCVISDINVFFYEKQSSTSSQASLFCHTCQELKPATILKNIDPFLQARETTATTLPPAPSSMVGSGLSVCLTFLAASRDLWRQFRQSCDGSDCEEKTVEGASHQTDALVLKGRGKRETEILYD